MIRRVRALACIAATACALAPAMAADSPPARPVDAEGWRNLTLVDLGAMHALLRDQTVIPFDKQNPAYPRWLEEGYLAARARAAQVTDAAGHFFTLRAYANGFHDPHLTVGGQTNSTRWPGFVVAGQGSKAIVVLKDPSDPAAPSPGAEIERCDGVATYALAQQRLGPFFFGAGQPGRWNVPFLFHDMGNPFAPLPVSCQVRTGDQVAEFVLQWRPFPQSMPDIGPALTNAGSGPSAAWGLAEPAPGVFWIGVPSFAHLEDTAPKLQALIDAVRSRGDEMRYARAIVIDTRGNAGGVLSWPRRLADAVFTPQVMKPARDAVNARRTATEVRASPENLIVMRRDNDAVAGETTAAEERNDRSYFRRLERAIKSKPPILRTGERKVSPEGGFTAQRPTGAPSPFPARVYLLSNGSCISACLMFADAVLKVPGVRLIGSETGGDTPYSGVRREALPSGLASLRFPQLAVRGRGRAPLEVYEPDIPYNGSWDDASVRAWVMALVEEGRATDAEVQR